MCVCACVCACVRACVRACVLDVSLNMMTAQTCVKRFRLPDADRTKCHEYHHCNQIHSMFTPGVRVRMREVGQTNPYLSGTQIVISSL